MLAWLLLKRASSCCMSRSVIESVLVLASASGQ